MGAKIPDKSLFFWAAVPFVGYLHCLKWVRVETGNSLLIPVPRAEFAEFGHNSKVFTEIAIKPL